MMGGGGGSVYFTIVFFLSSDPFLQYSNRARKHQISSVAFTQLNRFTVCKKKRVGGFGYKAIEHLLIKKKECHKKEKTSCRAPTAAIG